MAISMRLSSSEIEPSEQSGLCSSGQSTSESSLVDEGYMHSLSENKSGDLIANESLSCPLKSPPPPPFCSSELSWFVFKASRCRVCSDELCWEYAKRRVDESNTTDVRAMKSSPKDEEPKKPAATRSAIRIAIEKTWFNDEHVLYAIWLPKTVSSFICLTGQ